MFTCLVLFACGGINQIKQRESCGRVRCLSFGVWCARRPRGVFAFVRERESANKCTGRWVCAPQFSLNSSSHFLRPLLLFLGPALMGIVQLFYASAGPDNNQQGESNKQTPGMQKVPATLMELKLYQSRRQQSAIANQWHAAPRRRT